MSKKDTHVFKDFYDLGKFLGEGAHAAVHDCVEKKSGKSFAVKLQERVSGSSPDKEMEMLAKVKRRSPSSPLQ